MRAEQRASDERCASFVGDLSEVEELLLCFAIGNGLYLLLGRVPRETIRQRLCLVPAGLILQPGCFT